MTRPTSDISQKNCPAELAATLAEQLLEDSLKATSLSEATQMARLARMMGTPSAKNLSLAMTDRLGRSRDAERTADLWRGLLDRFGIYRGFSVVDRAMLDLGNIWSDTFPRIVMWAVRKRLENETRSVILPAEDDPLLKHLDRCATDQTGVNLNQLGEAVLGEKEARYRLNSAIELLYREEVNYVSIKISAIFSQINLVAWDESLAIIKDRLRELYRVGMQKRKFVNLDMEAYHDLELTVVAFREVLSEPEFHPFSAGIALQAYLPDSVSVQKELTTWARERCNNGGAPIKIRLVKGANLSMEAVEAELHGWRPTPYSTKAESDACFKQMLEYACEPENARAVKLGVASHNLFDVALALVLRDRYNVSKDIEIEMLQGMAPAQARVVKQEAKGLLLYTPIVSRDELGSALAYLIRRLDENTAPGNFLASLFSLKPNSEAWHQQKQLFLTAWENRNQVSTQSNRKTLPDIPAAQTFTNEPDTDWTKPRSRELLREAKPFDTVAPVSGPDEIEAALATAEKAQTSWRNTPVEERASLLRACAYQISRCRFVAISILRDEGKKAPAEADTEISEAIDFARYYAETVALPDHVEAIPLGTVVVTPPWNFPFAIPCGGVLAALVAGNTVILKPAPEVVQIGWCLVNLLWKAGIPKEALQFVACSDGNVGRKLIEDPRTSAIVLTGAYETARRFQDWRPCLRLFAETSGKNALVVSALADRELAAKDLAKSAFGHSGQKCSATSLAILEAEVYDDEKFLDLVKDAVASLKVGPASDPAAIVTPLVQTPSGDLKRALTTLEDGEKWLLQPEVSNEDPCLWSPGIKLGVKPGSWFHQTECFGPVLGIIRAKDLSEAVDIQNDVTYGLTAGFHSLDEGEIEQWRETVQAGNLYINRGTTGAIVQRQPFGGWKCSSIGPGFKAGGPNYINLFRTLEDSPGVDSDLNTVNRLYRKAWNEHFSIEHDPSDLKCESNVFRYRKRKGVLLRVCSKHETQIEMAKLAARICKVPLLISLDYEETEQQLADRLSDLTDEIDLVRMIEGPPKDCLLRAIADADLNWIEAPLLANGRLELSRWLLEQSISETMHRYGNLIERNTDLR